MRIAVVTAALLAAGAFAFWFFLDPIYHPVVDVDRKPYPMRRIDLEFPPVEKGIEYYGKLRIDVYIGRDGATDRVEVVSANVPARFTAEAVRSLEQTTWEPARMGWRRVRSLKRYEIDFAPPVRSLDRTLTAPGQ
jgi:hypothetical protein